MLCIAGATEIFNPTIDPALINKARDEDPESARPNGLAAGDGTLLRFCLTRTLMLRLIMTGRWSCRRVMG